MTMHHILCSSYRHSSDLETLTECCPRNGQQLELSCIYLMGI